MVGGVSYGYHKWNTEMADSIDPPIAHTADAFVQTQTEVTPQDETQFKCDILSETKGD